MPAARAPRPAPAGRSRWSLVRRGRFGQRDRWQCLEPMSQHTLSSRPHPHHVGAKGLAPRNHSGIAQA